MKKLLANLKFALPISLVIAFVHVNRRGIGDLDSWWHVRIGDQLRAGVPFADLGKSWSLYSGKWQTSQWLSEVLMSISHQAFGWRGMLWWRLAFGLLLLFVLVGTLARSCGTQAVVLTSVIASFVLVPAIQERPALVGLTFVAVLGASCTRILFQRRLPKSAWLWIPATILWANLHGSWILAPAALALAGVLASWANRSLRQALNSLLLVGLVVGAGCLTPLGWRGLVLPFTLQATAGKFITEWQRTTLADPLVYGLLVLLALLVFRWIRSKTRPTIGELIWVLAWVVFAFTAFRNVGPATLLIAPIAARRLDEWLGGANAKKELLKPAFLITLAIAVAIISISTSRLDPLYRVSPRLIAQRLSHSAVDLRIINDYNTSGVLLALGGDRIRLAVDGRSDRFDPNWLARYFALLQQPFTNTDLLDQLRPNAAVLESGSPLVWQLIQQRHWKQVMIDGPYVLVVAPTVKLWP